MRIIVSFQPKPVRVENENKRNKHQFVTVPGLPAIGTSIVAVVIFCLISFVKSSNCNVIQQEKGERLSELGSRWDHPFLTKEIAQDIKSLWQDSAIQVHILLRSLQHS